MFFFWIYQVKATKRVEAFFCQRKKAILKGSWGGKLDAKLTSLGHKKTTKSFSTRQSTRNYKKALTLEELTQEGVKVTTGLSDRRVSCSAWTLADPTRSSCVKGAFCSSCSCVKI